MAARYIPPLLRRGDEVRIVAPSSGFARPAFEAGIACIERAGLRPVFDSGLFTEDRYLAGGDDRRLAELHRALDDERATAIWCARGGYGATRLLPNIDIASVRKARQWLIGFSDVTALHCRWQSAGLASLHGPVVTAVDTWGAEAREALWGWLFAGRAPPLPGRVVAGHGAVEGPVMGGNLAVLAAMAGTGFLPDFSGAIVLIEDVGERPYRLDRSLTCLFQAGAFAGVAAFVIGQLSACEEPAGRTATYGALDVIQELLASRAPDVPVMVGLPVGHEPSSFPLPLGCPARLDCDRGVLEIEDLPRIVR